MKIWFDILTPKQLLFFEHFIDKLHNKNTAILCTSRRYSEVSLLARVRKTKLHYIGRHGGAKREEKLRAGLQRMNLLYELIIKEKPDVLVSFCSPEASRVAFGLGIRHIAFSDSPHASAVMRLSVPLAQKLLIPSIIPKREFEKFGINPKDIIPYKAIDAAITIKRKAKSAKKVPFKKDAAGKKNIIIRVTEEQASYSQKDSTVSIIKEITDRLDQSLYNIIVLARYEEQLRNLKARFGRKVKILKMTYDGKDILGETDIFVGSGGTMTAESALFGVPTVSYNSVPNYIERFLVKKGLITRESNPKRLAKRIEAILQKDDKKTQRMSRKLVATFEDPTKVLVKAMHANC